MRTLTLSKSGFNKLKAQQLELRGADFDDSIKSLIPGEWCILRTQGSDESWIGFGNPLVDEKLTNFYVVHSRTLGENEEFKVAAFIVEKVTSAFKKRQRFVDYAQGARIFYGNIDGLPGLIIDQFQNASVIQINTAGVDHFRDQIRSTVETLTGGKSYFLDNSKYREKESLPVFPKESLPDLLVEENGIRFKLRSEIIQKVGFYYDHRENRRQFMQVLERLKKPETGLDLFCYAGAWGLSALKAGVKGMIFVDQGDLGPEIEAGLGLNGFSGKGIFKRSDVFKFLDQCFSENKKFDTILCDPPAFAKSVLQKKDALDGYSKLHRKVLRLAAPGAFLAFSSCTHYVDHEEFQKNILEAAHKEGKKLQLLYCGLQGWDHPISSLQDRSNYIKSYFYLTEL